MPDFVRRWWPLALIVLVAVWLRTHELARRPMHADEANQAVKLGELLDAGRYLFDPHDHHGPSLYYAAVPIAWLRGQRSLAALDETTIRLLPALVGSIAIVLLAMLAAPRAGARWSLAAGRLGSRPSGAPASHTPDHAGRAQGYPWPAFAAAAFMAVSPPAVYYSRYFIQETLLVAFTLAVFLCVREWWYRGSLRWAAAAGVFAGLMQSTKASAPLFAGAAVAGLLAMALLPSVQLEVRARLATLPRPLRRHALRSLGVSALAAVLTAALLYSSFGTNPGGLRDAVATYLQTFTRFSGGDTGHEKPWWYYLRLFGWYRQGGLVWTQLGFSLLAIAGVLVAIVQLARAAFTERRLTTSAGTFPAGTALLVWASVYTLIVVAVFSVLSYKTPWHVVHFVPGMALLAAGALAAVTRLRTGKFVAIAAVLAVAAAQFQQTVRVAFLRPADARNPYAYVHSGPDILKFRPLALAAAKRSPDQPIRVIADEYWPLPWYLRGLPQVGYWSQPPPDCDGSLVIVSASMAERVQERLRGTYTHAILGLRPGVLCVVFTPDPDS
jgi:uncharacterized protein (TIGR03663 family)